MTSEPRSWRRLGAVLECRVDVRFALRRSVRSAADEAPQAQRMTAEEALRLFGQPDLPAVAEEVATALLPRS